MKATFLEMAVNGKKSKLLLVLFNILILIFFLLRSPILLPSLPLSLLAAGSDPHKPPKSVHFSIGDTDTETTADAGGCVVLYVNGDVYEDEIHDSACNDSGVYSFAAPRRGRYEDD